VPLFFLMNTGFSSATRSTRSEGLGSDGRAHIPGYRLPVRFHPTSKLFDVNQMETC
jgi:hypothetical protein